MFWSNRIVFIINKFIFFEPGIIFNDQNDDASIKNIVNQFELLASKFNLLTPKKRPASSISATIIVNRKTDDVKVSIGGAGGALIVS